MDPSAFDRLSRSLVTHTSRRGTLASLAAVLTGLLGRRGPGDHAQEAAAKVRFCRPLGRICFPDHGLVCCRGATCKNGRCQCPDSARPCRGRCLPKGKCCRATDCPGSQTCRQGRCQCPAGRKRCGKRCVAQAACCRHRECGARERCVKGRCRCAPGSKPCGGTCIRVANCCRSGECGANGECVGGTCQCAAGFKPCQGTCIGDADCCDECGGNSECVGGTCQCASGFKLCEGACIAEAECCGGCADDETCVDGLCGPQVCGAGGPCRVFITSMLYTGDLQEGGTGTGVAGADVKCQTRAQAAGLSGTYRAWISDSTPASAPAQRFTNTENTGPYVLVDANATQIAAAWTDLIDGALQAPINVDEMGATLESDVWTHTLANGTPGGLGDMYCLEWTSAGTDEGDIGNSTVADNTQWTAVGTAVCNVNLALYCFEQG